MDLLNNQETYKPLTSNPIYTFQIKINTFVQTFQDNHSIDKQTAE